MNTSETRNGRTQDVAYVRVSSLDQNTARQLEGVQVDRTFTDKQSGKDTNRPALQEALAYLREGDTLHVHSLDRLARNLQDLLAVVKNLTSRGVSIRFHKEALTFAGQGSQTVGGGADPFQALQLAVLGAVAEFERSLIRERQREGIAAAKKAGKHLGRAKSLTPEQIQEIKAQASQGEGKKALAKTYGISRTTLYAALKD